MFNILAQLALEIEGIFQHLLPAPAELLYIYISLLYAIYTYAHAFTIQSYNTALSLLVTVRPPSLVLHTVIAFNLQ